MKQSEHNTPQTPQSRGLADCECALNGLDLSPFEQYLNTLRYIKTNDTRYDEDYERTETRAYRIEFNTYWINSENSNPHVTNYTDIAKAVENVAVYEDAPSSDSFRPIKILYLEFVEVWLDEKDFEVEESETRIRYSDISYEIRSDKPYFDVIAEKAKLLLDHNSMRMFEDGELRVESFAANEETAQELLQEVEADIHKYITKGIDDCNDWEIYIPSSGKYRAVVFTNGDKEFSATLRIANHTYNPNNNTQEQREGYFVSVEIANNNPTSSRFRTYYSERFNGSNTIQDVVKRLQWHFYRMIRHYEDNESTEIQKNTLLGTQQTINDEIANNNPTCIIKPLIKHDKNWKDNVIDAFPEIKITPGIDVFERHQDRPEIDKSYSSYHFTYEPGLRDIYADPTAYDKVANVYKKKGYLEEGYIENNYDYEDFKLKEGYVAAVRANDYGIPDEVIGGAASDDYAVTFIGEEVADIYDGKVVKIIQPLETWKKDDGSRKFRLERTIPIPNNIIVDGLEGIEPKQVWEMTRVEFDQAPRIWQYLQAGKYKIKKDKRNRDKKTQAIIDKTRTQTKGETGEESPTEFYAEGRNLHKEIIQQALSEGKPVPAEVLKDYPELGQSKQPWEMAKEEFTDAVYNKGFDFAQLGIDKTPIQQTVKSYKATTDSQNKNIAKETIDKAIEQFYGAAILKAYKEEKINREQASKLLPHLFQTSLQFDNSEALLFAAEVAKQSKIQKLTRRQIDAIAERIFTKVPYARILRELVEVAQRIVCDEIIQGNAVPATKLETLSKAYKTMPVYEFRDSNTSIMQQFSTPIYIAWIMAQYCLQGTQGKQYSVFEPSAGNGLLVSAYPIKNVVVNELDNVRASVLRLLNYPTVTQLDASKPFVEYNKKFDIVMSNPPFYMKGHEKVYYDGLLISSFDHICVLRALDTMKDTGRAAFLIDGSPGSSYNRNAYFDNNGNFAGEYRNFMQYLYAAYNVEDLISIDGHKLYSRQGQATNLQILLINGRRTPKDVNMYPPKYNPDVDMLVRTPIDLYNRILSPMRKAKRITRSSEQEMLSKLVNAHKNKNKEEFAHWQSIAKSEGFDVKIVSGKVQVARSKYIAPPSEIIKNEVKYFKTKQ